MSKNNKEKFSDIEVDEIIFKFFKASFIILLIGLIIWTYFGLYKPKERKFKKLTIDAYLKIEKAANEIHRRDNQIYTKNDTVDILCETLAKRYALRGMNCKITKKGNIEKNFSFGKTKVTVYGMNAPAFFHDGTMVKDIIIDIDGDKGVNIIGVDRIPVRIYSSGRMGGMLSPVNCNVEDKKRYLMDISSLCSIGNSTNYMDAKFPLSYNVLQVGGKKGESRYIGKNISFLRADCTAYGSELLGMDDFCEQRGYQWLTACYHDYYCAIELSKD